MKGGERETRDAGRSKADSVECGASRVEPIGHPKRYTLNATRFFLRFTFFVVLLFCTLIPAPYSLSHASASGISQAAHQALFQAPLIWRAGGGDSASFKTAWLSKASLAEDGAVISAGSTGICEPENFFGTEGPVTHLSATWIFTGQVTLEVSATGNPQDYVPVTNGVPLQFQGRAAGSRIKWRATLAPQSSLSRVQIVYAGPSGSTGSFGNELLSGFKARKQIYVKGSAAGTLFQYQVPVKVGESAKSPDPCDVKLSGGVLSDFKDVRFTLADGETVLPHFLENVTGVAPDRVAAFWIKVPEIPKDGLPLYMYFSRPSAKDISSGEKVFDLFEHFDGATLDPEKWKLTIGGETGKAFSADSTLSLEKAKITTARYEFASGILEYQARVSAHGAVAGILRGTADGNNDLVAYASTLAGSEHAVATGGNVKANDPKPVTPGVFYVFRVRYDPNGDLVFQRFAEGGEGEAQAEVKYASGTGPASPVGLSSSNLDHSVECSWIRTRRAADPAPAIDREKTAAGFLEAVDLPEFYNVVTSPDGSLVAEENAPEGSYVSRCIRPGFEVRILKALWETEPSDEDIVTVGIATREGGKFYDGWETGKTRYVSRKEFDKGGQLRWKAVISGQQGAGCRGQENTNPEPRTLNPGLKKFTLKFYPGTIRVVLPNGGEKIAPNAPYSIFWNAEGYDPEYPIEIAYSGADGKEFKAIARSRHQLGDYTWNVPKGLSGEILIKVSDGVSPDDIFDVSDGAFSVSDANGVTSQDASGEMITTEGSREKNENETPELPREKKSLYELLIKVSDAAQNSASRKGFFEEGDIVMIKPAGYLWGKGERQKFLIVQARLTEKEAADLVMPKEVITVDKSGKKKTTIVSKRKHRLNLLKANKADKREASLEGLLKTRPVVDREMLEEKE